MLKLTERNCDKMKKRLFGKKAVSIAVAALMLASAVPAVSAADAQQSTTIKIIHTNDLHGYYKSTSKGQIGFERLKSLINEQQPDLILDIGDTFHGQAFATVENGESMAELLDAVNYDAMTPGNHDWSYGAEQLKNIDDNYGFKVLAANVVKDDGSDYFDAPYLVKDVTADDGTSLRVGVVGVIDDKFYTSTPKENVEGLQFTEEAAKTTEIAKKLKNEEKCDIVIAITHQHDCKGFVNNISDVDAVLAGHEHKLISEVYFDRENNPVPLFEAACYFTDIGVLSLTYDKEEKTLRQADEEFLESADIENEPDEDIAGLISSIESRESSVLNEVVGHSNEEYPYSWEDIRVAEQPIGRIVTASYLDWTGADVAMENSGGIRAGIPQGDVTYGDLIGISPYGNTLLVKQMTGQQILDVAEFAIEISRACDEVYTIQKEAVEKGEDPMQYSWPSNSGSALQISGLKAQYDLTKPQGSRLINATIGGESVDPDKIYNVAMNNYISDNESYPHISDAELVSEYGTCEQALRRYIEKNTFSEAASTPNLEPYSAEAPTDPEDGTSPEQPTDATDSEEQPTQTEPATDNTDGATDATQATEATTPSTGDNSGTGSASANNNAGAQSTQAGKVATGDSRSIIILLTLLMAAAAVTACAVKRKRGI